MSDDLFATLERRERTNRHVIDSLAHLDREKAMNLILSWFSLNDLEEIIPTLAGSPLPESEEATVVSKLRDALAFYAQRRSWRSAGMYMCGHNPDSDAVRDGGERARTALGIIEKGKTL